MPEPITPSTPERGDKNDTDRVELTSAAQDVWDVIVIGAGPAGSSAAIRSAQLGLRVLLVDAKKFPRHKVCGGCLNRVSVALLRELLGERHPFWQTTVPVRKFRVLHGGRRFEFDTPPGLAVGRAQLDQYLVATAIESGVTFRSPVLARLADIRDTHHEVRLKVDGAEQVARAKLVVLACGLDNRQVTADQDLQHVKHRRSRVGVEAIYSRFEGSCGPGVIDMAVAPQGYVGITEIEGERLHVAAAVDKSALQKLGPQELVQDILRQAGATTLPSNDDVTWRGTLPLTSRAKRLGTDRVLLVGDSAGYVEPFTGEGVRWALQSGMAVGRFARRACQQRDPSIVADWEEWYARHIAKDQRICRMLSWGLRRPLARWLTHGMLRASPVFANKIINRINQKAE